MIKKSYWHYNNGLYRKIVPVFCSSFLRSHRDCRSVISGGGYIENAMQNVNSVRYVLACQLCKECLDKSLVFYGCRKEIIREVLQADHDGT